jgi:hypothetical protein
LTAVVDPRFGVAAPFASDAPDRAAARRAAARADPGDAGVVSADPSPSAGSSAPESLPGSPSSTDSPAGSDFDSEGALRALARPAGALA